MVTGTRVTGAIDESDAQHAAMRDALAARDADAARSATRRHLMFVKEYLVSNEISATEWRST
jgi:DNA-binding FadR family transcriptional regulator